MGGLDLRKKRGGKIKKGDLKPPFQNYRYAIKVSSSECKDSILYSLLNKKGIHIITTYPNNLLEDKHQCLLNTYQEIASNYVRLFPLGKI